MRFRTLTPAAAVGAALLTLGAPAASAREHPRADGPCHVNINIAPRLIEAGESILAFGRLRCGGLPARASAGRTVRLMQRAAGERGFHLVQTTTTDAHGFYELTRAGIEYNSTFFVVSRGASSGRRSVKVLAHVTLSGPPDGSQLLTGAANSVTFSGAVSPHDVGARVVLQRQNADTGDEWHRIDLGRVGPEGTYSITHTFHLPGDANIRVLVRSQRRNVASPSDVLSYDISQAQNARLTIQASADPISFGQQVTIGGTLAGRPDTAVTLLAHSARKPGFVAVAEARTDTGGKFTFPAQAPVASTFYEVRGAGRESAVLYEGVRDLLTAQVSANTVSAGQALTFSGAVAPDHSGHVIYLQRQDHVGGEFHVVQVGFVGAGSQYSIVHSVYDRARKPFG